MSKLIVKPFKFAKDYQTFNSFFLYALRKFSNNLYDGAVYVMIGKIKKK